MRQIKLLPPKETTSYVRRPSTRRSAYAFSHQRGFGALITSGKNMRIKSMNFIPSSSYANKEKYPKQQMKQNMKTTLE